MHVDATTRVAQGFVVQKKIRYTRSHCSHLHITAVCLLERTDIVMLCSGAIQQISSCLLFLHVKGSCYDNYISAGEPRATFALAYAAGLLLHLGLVLIVAHARCSLNMVCLWAKPQPEGCPAPGCFELPVQVCSVIRWLTDTCTVITDARCLLSTAQPLSWVLPGQ